MSVCLCAFGVLMACVSARACVCLHMVVFFVVIFSVAVCVVDGVCACVLACVCAYLRARACGFCVRARVRMYAVVRVSETQNVKFNDAIFKSSLL